MSANCKAKNRNIQVTPRRKPDTGDLDATFGVVAMKLLHRLRQAKQESARQSMNWPSASLQVSGQTSTHWKSAVS